MLNKAKAVPVAAEFFGTGLLVSMILVLSNTTAVSYFIATSAAVTLAAIVMMFGSVSGAHVNPAVTFGMWTARKMGTVRAISYIAAQLLGGLASWQLYQYLTNRTLSAKSVSFDTRIWVAELVGAAILSFAVAAVISKQADALNSALAIGTAFFVAIVVASTASAGYINPAVALGARSFSGVYVLGPLVGGLVGVNLFYMLFGVSEPKKASKLFTRSGTKKTSKKK